MDYVALQKKWQEKWAADKVFEATPDDRPKFFLTFPYPYINAFPHIGHLFTAMRVDAFARYKRLRGFNVLFPQGWHATGSPILNAAKRVQEKEPKQIKIMKQMGFSDEEIPKFEDPAYWVEYFAPQFKKDFSALGLSIDWTREFVTTSLNPHYDAFIRWQFNTLKKKGYVIQGKFPVVWDPVLNSAVGDHDRSEGEGETPQEFVLIKFAMGDEYLVVATLRPETMYGQTNLWANPDLTYVRAKVDSEVWIVSEPCIKKLEQQGYSVSKLEDVPGSSLIGKRVVAPYIEREIPLLPSFFPKADKGTGLVTSVPSDAPDDYIGLRDLWNDEKLCSEYGLDASELKKIEIIPIISTDIGDQAAVTLVEEMKIKNQHDRKKLEEAKKIVYKKGFYEGVMNDNCDGYAGMPVQKAKELMKRELLENGQAHLLYELTGRVVSRGLNECVVKIVDDQWFMDYANPAWKEAAHTALDNLKLYPEKVRAQFDFVIDWLHEWACTREEGLGTRLPWDSKWLIESLSDSTIYTAYYTIAPFIKQIDPAKIDDSTFDYLFYGKGTVTDPLLIQAREHFEYYYPCDFRNSGKDLVQNHLTFYLFNHVAMFEADKWPAGIGVNGWLLIDGQKMSKSLGNFIPARDMALKYGADASRATVLNGGEGIDDANWDTSFAETFAKKLESILFLVNEHYGKGTSDVRDVDRWLESKMHSLLLEITPLMEETLFRTALQKIFFEYQNMINKYLSKVEEVNKEIFCAVLRNWMILISPYTPHIAEEAWSLMGCSGYVSLAAWPEADLSKINATAEGVVEFVDDALGNIENLRGRLGKDSLDTVSLGVAQPWKYVFAQEMMLKLQETFNVKELMEHFKGVSGLEEVQEEVLKLIPAIVKKPARLPKVFLSREDELKAASKVKIELEKRYDCSVTIEEEGELAQKAFPGGLGVRL